MKSELNVFQNDANFFFEPRFWWRNFFKNIKYAYQRIVRGYCDEDVYDFSFYLSHVIGEGLHDFIDNNIGHPYDMSAEEWRSKLLDIQKDFDIANASLPVNMPFNKCMEEEAKQYQKRKDGFEKIAKIINELWI